MRRALLIFGGLAVGLLLITLVLLNLSRGAQKVFTLPNGVRVELLGTRVGTANFSTEKDWHEWARKILPVRWQGSIPLATSGSCSSGTNSVTVYVQVRDANGKPVNNTPRDSYRTEDDAGFAYQSVGGNCTMGGGTTMRMDGLILLTFPRRQPRFKLQLIGKQGEVLATLDVENPVRGPFPEWQPLPLPQTQSNGPVSLSLQGLAEGGKDFWRYVQPKWQVASADPQWIKARVRAVTFVDSLGNIGQWLSPREKAWKVRALVGRSKLEEFSPSEFVQVTNIAIPTAGQCTYFGSPVDHGEESVTIHAIAGPGEIVSTNGGSWQMTTNGGGYVGHSSTSYSNLTIEKWGSRSSFMFVEVGNLREDDEIDFVLHDDSGREIKTSESRGYDSRSGGRRLYMREFTPDDAKALNLAVIVNRPLIFEFMVNPVDVKTAPKK